MSRDITNITGCYGVEEGGDYIWPFKISIKEKMQEIEIWHGYLDKDGKQIKLAFKDFTCPPEGGVITGHTTEGKTVKGKIEKNRRLVFTLESADGEKHHFEG